METVLIISQIILYVASLFALLRLMRGPRLMDRIMSIDGLFACIIGLMVLESIRQKSGFFIELILVFSLINFIGTIAYVYYLNNKYSFVESPDVESENKNLFFDDYEGCAETAKKRGCK